jgi:hypothetical protein
MGGIDGFSRFVKQGEPPVLQGNDIGTDILNRVCSMDTVFYVDTKQCIPRFFLYCAEEKI